MNYYVESIAKENSYCYICDPFAISSIEPVFDINMLLSDRDAIESNFLFWLAIEFNKMGDFKFIKAWEDNSYSQLYFLDGSTYYPQQQISYMDFCWELIAFADNLHNNILYVVSQA